MYENKDIYIYIIDNGQNMPAMVRENMVQLVITSPNNNNYNTTN